MSNVNWARVGLALTAILIPGGGIVVGAVLLMKAFKKKKAQKISPEPLKRYSFTGEFPE